MMKKAKWFDKLAWLILDLSAISSLLTLFYIYELNGNVQDLIYNSMLIKFSMAFIGVIGVFSLIRRFLVK